ncbi:MAG: hypothetical protein LBG59_09070 [Candidatus Peribacteria bacterium]|jgi:hypothetical protein|nr:hypothetical protein [Candidatus Peribacteria bacterium]
MNGNSLYKSICNYADNPALHNADTTELNNIAGLDEGLKEHLITHLQGKKPPLEELIVFIARYNNIKKTVQNITNKNKELNTAIEEQAQQLINSNLPEDFK